MANSVPTNWLYQRLERNKIAIQRRVRACSEKSRAISLLEECQLIVAGGRVTKKKVLDCTKILQPFLAELRPSHHTGSVEIRAIIREDFFARTPTRH